MPLDTPDPSRAELQNELEEWCKSTDEGEFITHAGDPEHHCVFEMEDGHGERTVSVGGNYDGRARKFTYVKVDTPRERTRAMRMDHDSSLEDSAEFAETDFIDPSMAHEFWEENESSYNPIASVEGGRSFTVKDDNGGIVVDFRP